MPTRLSRRRLLAAAATAALAPTIVPRRAFGANDKFTLACIGMGGQGRADMGSLLGFTELRVVQVCDVVGDHAAKAKEQVDKKYKNADCKVTPDYREVLARPDVDAVLIATPDHWHALISIEAMKAGKDVYCEKPETLTVREGRAMADVVARYGRVFSGGSQRVWGDYNYFHKSIKAGAIGDVREVFVDCGGPPQTCYLPAVETPKDVDWDRWLGPAPWRPFHPSLIKGGFRPWRDYSGGGMTDWGAHNFGGALFACGLHETGPVEILPPEFSPQKLLTFVFASGVRMYHRGGWGGNLCFRGTAGELPKKNEDKNKRTPAPDVYIPHYKGKGGIFGDFVHCVRTRELPFRNIERAHRTATMCHLGNIAYQIRRPIKWDPVNEQVIGDDEANRLLGRDMREPWRLG
ncbi:MAG TPA: Gfo/Idh/MocA family oxidoreductase [Tepidisphaeraceae bacterium]|nr:Gfo/Idh/MocA family oxidoreductase [Tepidisphaeraceae bacterium]